MSSYRSPTYNSWEGMWYRCTKTRNPSYKWYGGRGIKVCDRWKHFGSFLEDMGEKPEGTSLDRIDTDGDYSPENCKWSSNTEQQNNRTNNRSITFQGKTFNMSQWSYILGIPRSTLSSRIYRGWTVEDALTKGI